MKQEIIIPSSLSEITLKKYQEFCKVSEGFENERNEFIDKKIVSIFCDIPIKNVGLMTKQSVDEVVEHILMLLQEQPRFTNRFKFHNSGQFKDKEFGFIPSLKDITLDEYADLDNYIVDAKDMHKAMSVLFRPIVNKSKENYEIEDYHGSDMYSEVMLYAPLDIVLGARVFFYHLGKELSRITTISLMEEMVEELGSLPESSLIKRGVGINHFTPLLQVMLQDLNKSESSELILP